MSGAKPYGEAHKRGPIPPLRALMADGQVSRADVPNIGTGPVTTDIATTRIVLKGTERFCVDRMLRLGGPKSLARLPQGLSSLVHLGAARLKANISTGVII
ncbi:MAG: hypothetical protein AAF829_04140 [Pseudomonadota bacterium]